MKITPFVRNICFIFAVLLGFISLKAGVNSCTTLMGGSVALLSVSLICEIIRFLSAPTD